MNIIYHLDMAIETLKAIAPKQCDSYVDGEIKGRKGKMVNRAFTKEEDL